MSKDEPGRQPFAGSCSANSTAVESGLGEIGPVLHGKRLAIVESVSAQLVTSSSGERGHNAAEWAFHPLHAASPHQHCV